MEELEKEQEQEALADDTNTQPEARQNKSTAPVKKNVNSVPASAKVTQPVPGTDQPGTEKKKNKRGSVKKTQPSLEAMLAFEDYYALGVNRSLEALWVSYQADQSGTKPSQRLATLKEWSSKYGWQEKARARLEKELEKDRQAVERERLEKRKQRRQLLDVYRGVAVRLLADLQARAKLLETPIDPKIIAAQGQLLTPLEAELLKYKGRMNPGDLKEITAAIKLVLEQERLEYNDMPAQKHQVTFEKMTDAELIRFIAGEVAGDSGS